MAGFFEEDTHPVEASPAPEPSFFEEDAVVDDQDTLAQVGQAVTQAFGGPASQLLEVLTAPFKMMDPVTGAPVRAGVGALQRNEGGAGAVRAFVEQLQAGMPKTGDSGATIPGDILPSTPTGEDMASKGMASAGIAKPFADSMAPAMGALAESQLDLTQLIPSGAVRSVAKAGAKGVGAVTGGIGSVVKGGENIAAKGLMRVGQVATQGVINPHKAVKAAALLSSRELILPGTKDFGAMSKAAQDVGNARAMLQFEKVSVPGSHMVALQVSDLINANKGRTIGHPNADALIEQISSKAFTTAQRVVPQIIPPRMIEETIFRAQAELMAAEQEYASMVTGLKGNVQGPDDLIQMNSMLESKMQIDRARFQIREMQARLASGEPFSINQQVTVREPRDLTLDELDDVTGMLDELVYTGQGNEKMLRRIWGPTLKNSRAALDKVMQTIPEGAMFKETKGKYEALATAGKHRSKLMEGMSLVGAMGAGAITFDPSALLILGLRPRTYFQLMGILKAPREIVGALTLARDSGKAVVIRDALKSLASKSPELTERIIRSVALVSGKPEGQQFLTEEEAGSLGLSRSFDPEEIASERQRISSDKGMTTVMKAKALNSINKNGYIVVDRPAPHAAEPETVEQKVFGGREGLDTLIQSLQNSAK